MNNSERTTIIAEGIHLWARVQNLPGRDARDDMNQDVRNWVDWSEQWARWVPFVKAEQFALFDRVNAGL